MAEAPPPPPNLDYNSFKTWRKNNGIRGTVQELSAAWREYSASRKTSIKKRSTKKSPSKKSPSKKSPNKPQTSPKRSPTKAKSKKSPIRFTGEIPGDVLRLIGGRIHEGREVGRMTAAGKKPGQTVEQELIRMCHEEPTELEILSALETIPLPITFRMTVFNDNTRPMHGVLYLFEQDKSGVIAGHSMNNKLEHKRVIPKWKKPIRGFAESFMHAMGKNQKVHIRLSPISLMDVYRRRGSCQRVDNQYLKTVRDRVETLFFASIDYLFSFALNIRMEFYDMITGEVEHKETWYREGIALRGQITILANHSTLAYSVGWLCNSLEVAQRLDKVGNVVYDDRLGERKRIEAIGSFLNACIVALREAYQKIQA